MTSVKQKKLTVDFLSFPLVVFFLNFAYFEVKELFLSHFFFEKKMLELMAKNKKPRDIGETA